MKTYLAYCTALLVLVSCTKGGSPAQDESHSYYDPNDYSTPVLVVNTPADNQVYTSGSSIDVTGTITDNSLYQGTITIQNDDNGLIVKDQYYEIHYIPSYNFSLAYVASVAVPTNFTVTVKFEDHGHNEAVKTIKIKVNP